MSNIRWDRVAGVAGGGWIVLLFVVGLFSNPQLILPILLFAVTIAAFFAVVNMMT